MQQYAQDRVAGGEHVLTEEVFEAAKINFLSIGRLVCSLDYTDA